MEYDEIIQVSRKNEYITLFGQKHTVPPGYFITSMLRLNQSHFSELEHFLYNIRAASSSYTYDKDMELYNEDSAIQTLCQIKRLVNAHLELHKQESVSLLRQAFFFLPCAKQYQRYNNEARAVQPSVSEKSLVDWLARNEADQIGVDHTTPIEFLTPWKKSASTYQDSPERTLAEGWTHWLDFLLDDSPSLEDIPWYPICLAVIDQNSECYADILFSALVEMQGLCQDLKAVYLDEDTYFKEALEYIPSPEHIQVLSQSKDHILQQLMFRTPMPRTIVQPGQTDKGTAYSVASLSELLIVELNFLESIHRRPMKCKLCGKFFIPFRAIENYCKNPNSEYRGQTCAKIGAQLDFQQRHPFTSTPEGKQYKKDCWAYQKWVTENLSRAMKQIDAKYAELRRIRLILNGHDDAEYFRELDDEKHDDLKKIRLEIANRHTQWHQRAAAAIDAFNSGSITVEQLRDEIKLPSVHDRSPSLAKLLIEVKEIL